MKTPSSQRGVTLVVALIFLVLMSLFALSAFNSSSSNLRIVGNTQARQESLAAAQVAVETTISAADLATAASPIQVDIDGDGATDYTATLTPAPTCTRMQPVPPPAIDDPSVPLTDEQKLCPRNPDGSSNCYDTEWNIRAAVSDSRSNTQLAVNQGVKIRSVNNGPTGSASCT